VESTHLSAFFQSVTSWPVNEAGLAALSEKVAQVLESPFVAIQRPASGKDSAFPLLGWKSAGPSDHRGPEAVRQEVSARVRQAESLFGSGSSSAPELRQLQLSDGLAGVAHLAIVRISGQAKSALAEGRGPAVPPASGSSPSKDRIDHGWLLVGSAKALGPKEEVMCLAIAQKLASVADCAAFEAAIQLRNQFLSIASHELKTPLTSIYGVLQLQQRMLSVKKDEPAPVQRERQESYLKMVIRQTQRLNELIDGLLDVSRIQNGRFMTEPSDTDVAALVRDTVTGRLAVIAHEAGVRLSHEVPDSLHGWVDPVRMEEVVTNLVMNAIRFSPEGGVVWIRLKDDGGALVLTVRDQGPAVPVEDQERIFQPFERAQRTARFGGLGLGLFISRQIAQLHGGNVRLAESVPGKGNLFEAVFPRPARQAIAS
jgi:signal transduction histidine kinase